tara:strand:- start:2022 stop:2195 length:174 start_codon:yes stop_codon:yes gene_type:complete
MKFSVEELDRRINEIPTIIESLKNELNQLVGYKTALVEMEDDKKPKEKKKDDAKAVN